MTNYTGNDIYCDLIIPRKIDIEVLKETDNILVYKHTKPFWENHIVVVPKTHIHSLIELDIKSETADQLLSAIQEAADEMRSNFGSCRVLTNLGEYQDSKHLHFHVSQGKDIKLNEQ